MSGSINQAKSTTSTDKEQGCFSLFVYFLKVWWLVMLAKMNWPTSKKVKTFYTNVFSFYSKCYILDVVTIPRYNALFIESLYISNFLSPCCVDIVIMYMYIRYNLLLIKLVVSVSNNAMQSCYLSKKNSYFRGGIIKYIFVYKLFSPCIFYMFFIQK